MEDLVSPATGATETCFSVANGTADITAPDIHFKMGAKVRNEYSPGMR